MVRASRVLLGAAILVHILLLVSWRTGVLNPLFFDATVTHGVRGWDFYALYQAGHNVLTGHSAYQSDGTVIEVVIPGGTYTPFRYLPLSAYTLGVLLNAVPPRWAYRLWAGFVELVLLACIALTWRAERDMTLLLFLYNTGARVQEAADLRVAHLDLDAIVAKEILRQSQGLLSHFEPSDTLNQIPIGDLNLPHDVHHLGLELVAGDPFSILSYHNLLLVGVEREILEQGLRDLGAESRVEQGIEGREGTVRTET